MPTRVKICGITRLEDARLAVELGASALGFNFYPRSPRYIAPAAASAIIRQLQPFVVTVGVFADETDAGRVCAVAREARVGALQLHGPRFPAANGPTVDGLVVNGPIVNGPTVNGMFGDYPVIRAVPICDRFEPEQFAASPVSAFLLDAFDPELIGGTGKTIDWAVAREAKKYGPVILAGGLTPENVGEAIRQVKPFAVDVASGVESAPGKKDPAKLRAFFAAVEKADRQKSEVRS